MIRMIRPLTYPSGFAVGYVLISFAATPTPVSGLPRPLVAFVVVAIALALVSSAVLRSIPRGSVVASALVLGLAAPWLPIIVITAGTLWWLLVLVLRRRRNVPAPRLGTERLLAATGAVAGTFLVVSLAVSVPALANVGATPAAPEQPRQAQQRPDIVIVLLDGYPRSDVLRDGFDLDNAPFEGALEELDFTIKPGSRSNYSATWATLASMLNGRYLQDIPGLAHVPQDPADQYRALSHAIDRSSLPSLLRAYGYTFEWVASPFEGAAPATADKINTGGQITSFELSLISDSLVLPLLQAVAPRALLAQHRDRIIDALQAVPDLAQADNEPVFAVVHVLSPHPPIVFGADGELADPADCFPECSLYALVDDEQWELFPTQVLHLNRLVIAAVSEAIRGNPEAVFVVMSDHGTRPPGAPEETVLANFTAVRMPNAATALTNDVSPVNILPEIMNATLDTALETHPYRGWISASEHPLSMEPVR